MLEQIKQLYAFIKKWFWALPMWKRTILTSIIGAFAGSSVIGFLNRFALYYYALKQGFRIPVEGVEYLDLSISLVSFVIILISTIGTIFLYSYISKMVSNANFLFKRDSSFFIIEMLILLMTVYLFAFSLKYLGSDISDETFKIIAFLFFSPILIAIGVIYFYDVLVIEKKRKVITLSIVLFLIAWILISLFNQKIYSSFLATIHYGGRIPVVIEYREADNTAASATGELLIRTSHSVTILNTDTCAHEEIPAERVSKIGFIKE